uniref:UPF0609 C4orf27-like protein n=1 Tax=Ascaris lumbricoides TaxID=6252 RepID=A0A0M3IRB7_ASCLU
MEYSSMKLFDVKFQLKRTGSPNNDNVEENVKHAKLNLSDDEIKNDLRSKFLVSFPPEFFRFWNDIQALIKKTDNNDPCKALNALKKLQLLGVFHYLNANTSETSTIDENFYLTKDRYTNDLPEMQTIAVYDGGRFAYWRDTPNDEKPLLVHVDSKMEHFTKLELIGVADPVYMIAYLKSKAGDTLPKVDDILARLLHPDSALCGGNGKYDAKDESKRSIETSIEYSSFSDTPNDEKPLLVHVDSKMEHFTKLELIGVADPVYMIAYLKSKAGDTLPKVDDILARLLHPDSALCGGNGKYDAKAFHKKYDAMLKELRAKRRKQSLGEPFHGLGIVVKVENDIGYRPLSEKPARLKHQLEEIATTKDAEMKRKLMESIMELVSYVQVSCLLC